jgi:2-iminoacetate synthase
MFTALWQQHSPATVAAKIREKTGDQVQAALARAEFGAADLEDLAALLSPAAAPFLEDMAQLSHRLTVERFGHTMQLYAPLYLSNVCQNICTYCGFSAENAIRRKVLNDAEILADAAVIKVMGFDHVLLVTGETGRVGLGYLVNAVRLLRRQFASISIEVQPLTEAEYAALAAEGVSAVLVYQETYDPVVYARHHLKGPKADIAFRLETPDRLGRAGMKKIGLGALFGLADWRTDAWFVGLHLRYLEQTYWRTRYSLSFPRLRPHEGPALPAPVAEPLPAPPGAGSRTGTASPGRDAGGILPFDEHDLVQAACAFRLFSHEAELSLSTRESARFRDHAFRLGFTAMSAGSKTNPGGYSSAPESLEQFAIDDDRPPAEVAAALRGAGYEPVWKDWDPTYDGAGVIASARD